MPFFEDELADIARLTDAALSRLIPGGEGPEAQVLDAMRYSSLAGGKRLRPFLVIATADLFNVSRTSSERVAAAIEMVHTYSLVHDDLPSMDDDDLRRGRLSKWCTPILWCTMICRPWTTTICAAGGQPAT